MAFLIMAYNVIGFYMGAIDYKLFVVLALIALYFRLGERNE